MAYMMIMLVFKPRYRKHRTTFVARCNLSSTCFILTVNLDALLNIVLSSAASILAKYWHAKEFPHSFFSWVRQLSSISNS